MPMSVSESPRGSASPAGAPHAAPAGDIAARWTALHEAAAVVSALAGLVPAEPEARVRAFPAMLGAASGWRRRLAAQGIDDLTAVLQTGITALLAVHARGAVAGAPARALWDEFVTARDALVALCPAEGQARRALG